jgi:hypothetical protein
MENAREKIIKDADTKRKKVKRGQLDLEKSFIAKPRLCLKV